MRCAKFGVVIFKASLLYLEGQSAMGIYALFYVDGQATVERGFSVNKDILALNIIALSLTALCLIHDSISAGQIEIADCIITDELLTSCSHASNRYKMYLMENTKKMRSLKNQEKESSSRRVYFSKEMKNRTTSNSTEVN